MSVDTNRKIWRWVRRDIIVFFGPLIAALRLRKKRGLNYFRQIRVLYRYSNWK